MLPALVELRPGEGKRLGWLCAIGILYAAATTVGESVAESVFVGRVGAAALPRMFLFKACVDVVAAALYMPLTAGRSAGRVWRAALGVYVGALGVAWAAALGGTSLSAYALYIAHECAGTVLTIHWGVFILEALDASQARRLFPLLFTAARLGGVLGGSALRALAGPLGAVNLLWVASGFAAMTGVLSLLGRRRRDGAGPDAPAPASAPVPASAPALAGEPRRLGFAGRLLAGWRQALESPLVRAIALSTAAMVLTRYGLRMVALGEIREAFAGEEDRIAGFLGWFSMVADTAGAVLGVLVVPQLFARFGIGVVNVAYAASTAVACGVLIATPGLVAAAVARFADVQFKHAVKTPLSTLFYGAEPPPRRALARACIFGAVIPAATVVTGVVFELAADAGLAAVASVSLGSAVLFTAASALQNRRWRSRMVELLGWELAHAPPPHLGELARVHAALAAELRAVQTEVREGETAVLDNMARGLACPSRRVRALAEEVLAETIPRRRAHALVKELVRGKPPSD